MDYEQFKVAFAEDLKTNLQKLGIEADVSEHHIEKLNDSYEALSVTPKGSSIGVNANLDEIFHAIERGRDYNEVLSGVTESLKGSLEHMPKLQVSDLTNYAEMKNKLAMEVVSAERNAKMLQNVPHEQMEDIAVVYRLVLNSSKGASSTVLVTNDLMDKFGITHEQLHDDAMKNAPLIRPAEIKGMEETLNEMQGGPALEPDPDEILFVAGVPDQSHGAAVIAYPNFFEDAAEKLGGDYFIIPSSIHEVLLVKDTGEMNSRDLAAMIKEVNATEVAPEDVLTDHAYHYDSKEHIFESADKFEERQAEMEAAGPEEDRGSLIEQLNAKKEAAKEAPEKAAKDAVRKNRGGEAL
jgi:hypothetical protein